MNHNGDNMEQQGWRDTFEQIKDKHDDAYKAIERAIKNEEDDQPLVALGNYKRGITLIDEALNIPVSLPDEPTDDDSWKKACGMIRKMKQTKVEVTLRINSLIKSQTGNESIGINSSGDISSQEETHRQQLKTYSELAEALKEIDISENLPDAVKELVFCCENVNFYHINGNGNVTTSLDNTILQIWKITKAGSEVNGQGNFFMQISKSSEPVLPKIICLDNDDNEESMEVPKEAMSDEGAASSTGDNNVIEIIWTFPLLPKVSPCYRTSYNAFIFPDLNVIEGATTTAIGIVISEPSDEIVLEILNEILEGIVYQERPVDTYKAPIVPRSLTAITVSQNIVKGAYYLSQGLIRGSQKTGQFLNYSTPYLISKISKAPPDAPPVSTNVQTGIEIAKTVSGTAASVTRCLAEKIGTATAALGRFLAPHIQTHGSRLLSHSFGMTPEDASEKMTGVLTVAAGAVEAFGTVYNGLEESASILGQNLSNNSVKIIEHKYGQSAASVASTTFETAGNVFAITQNVKYITPKGFVRTTAKGTGKAIVAEYKPNIP